MVIGAIVEKTNSLELPLDKFPYNITSHKQLQEEVKKRENNHMRDKTIVYLKNRFGVPVDELPLPQLEKDQIYSGIWRQIARRVDYEAMQTYLLAKTYGMIPLNFELTGDSYSSQSAFKNKLVNLNEVILNGDNKRKPKPHVIANPKEREIIKNITTSEGILLTKYHEEAYRKLFPEAKEPFDLSDTFSKFLELHLTNTSEAKEPLPQKIWVEKDGLAEGFELYGNIYRSKNGDKYVVDDVATLAGKGKARPDISGNYKILSHLLGGLFDNYVLFEIWRDLNGDKNNILHLFYNESFKAIGARPHVLQFYDIDDSPNAKSLGKSPSYAIPRYPIDLDGILTEIKKDKTDNMYETSKKIANKLIPEEKRKRFNTKEEFEAFRKK